LPPDTLGCVISRAQLLLYGGRYPDAWLGTEPEQVYEMIGWEDDRARSQLLRADAACRIGELDSMRQSLESAARWILHSGSVEHLCLYHLVRCRTAKKAGDIQAAQLAVDEGLHLARRCGLVLYHVELLSMRAELLMVSAEAVGAEDSAREAMGLASSSGCQFVWGVAEAGQLLGRALVRQGRLNEALAALEEVRSLRARIGDGRVRQTETLIESINLGHEH
jgi:ATP/maltotriose-dependent transcriptional regulator MalT